MRVLLVHNYYRFRGGEDSAFETSRDVLSAAGLEVGSLTTSSAEAVSELGRLGVLKGAVWGRTAARDFLRRVVSFGPDVVHFHNTFPTMSPAHFRVVREAGLPTVATLHNYRYACLNGLRFRGGRACSLCVGTRLAGAGIRHACYGDSRLVSAGAALIRASHMARGTWAGGVDRYIVPSDYARVHAVESGVPSTRLVVIPHTVFPVPEAGTGSGGYAVFAGRLSTEKGIRTLVRAWHDGKPGLPLKVAGSGPLAEELRSTAAKDVELLGSLDRLAVLELLSGARLAIVPSESGETFGLAALEALAVGTPVLVSRVGALPEFLSDAGSGTFEPGDPVSLIRAVRDFLEAEVPEATRREAARRSFEERFAPSVHVASLMRVYRSLSGSGRTANTPRDHSAT